MELVLGTATVCANIGAGLANYFMTGGWGVFWDNLLKKTGYRAQTVEEAGYTGKDLAMDAFLSGLIGCLMASSNTETIDQDSVKIGLLEPIKALFKTAGIESVLTNEWANLAITSLVAAGAYAHVVKLTREVFAERDQYKTWYKAIAAVMIAGSLGTMVYGLVTSDKALWQKIIFGLMGIAGSVATNGGSALKSVEAIFGGTRTGVPSSHREEAHGSGNGGPSGEGEGEGVPLNPLASLGPSNSEGVAPWGFEGRARSDSEESAVQGLLPQVVEALSVLRLALTQKMAEAAASDAPMAEVIKQLIDLIGELEAWCVSDPLKDAGAKAAVFPSETSDFVDPELGIREASVEAPQPFIEVVVEGEERTWPTWQREAVAVSSPFSEVLGRDSPISVASSVAYESDAEGSRPSSPVADDAPFKSISSVVFFDPETMQTPSSSKSTKRIYPPSILVGMG